MFVWKISVNGGRRIGSYVIPIKGSLQGGEVSVIQQVPWSLVRNRAVLFIPPIIEFALLRWCSHDDGWHEYGDFCIRLRRDDVAFTPIHFHQKRCMLL